MDRKKLLKGVIDIHVHAGPSVAARELDAADMLKEAEAAGYRGFLVKDHYFPSMMGCQMVQRHLGSGSVEVFGSMCLNNAMGLFNLNAVDVAYGMGAKMIYFPTVSSKNHIDAHKGHFAGAGKMSVPETPVVYVDENGRLDPAAVRILEYIQAHASVQDDNGVIHNANIIWGTSEKPQLGNAIELVVVATGFAGDVSAAGTMKQIIPPVRSVEPAKDPVAPVLEPIKPVVPPKAAVQRPPEQVMLGAKSTRYSNIELLLSKPAYQSRNSKFVVQMPGGRKEVLKEENDAGQQAQQDAQGGSLFD